MNSCIPGTDVSPQAISFSAASHRWSVRYCPSVSDLASDGSQNGANAIICALKSSATALVMIALASAAVATTSTASQLASDSCCTCAVTSLPVENFGVGPVLNFSAFFAAL